MSLFLVLAFLFFMGSVIGWMIEVVWRRFVSSHKWVNPGFLNGPYLPIYGFSICTLFALSFLSVSFVRDELYQKLVLFILMALAITLMEFFAGLIFIKGMKIRLWDYSDNRFNFMGIICLPYSICWVILSAIYYFLIHPRILNWLYWFTGHQIFIFVTGFFYGIFFIDVCYTFNVTAKIRRFATEKKILIRYESLKLEIQKLNEEFKEKSSFLFPLKSKFGSLKESLARIFKD